MSDDEQHSGGEDGEGAQQAQDARPVLQLDKKAEQGFVAALRALPPKAPNTVRLFERDKGDFYTAHDDDAHFVATTVFKTTTVIKMLGGDNGVPGCAMSRMQAISLMKDLLLHRQRRVEVWASEGKQHGWSLKRRGSPGNLQDFEDLLFATADLASPPMVIALKLGPGGKEKLVGVAYADATLRKLGVCELVDTDVYSSLEGLIVQLNVKECVVPDEKGSYELAQARAVLERCGVVITEQPKGHFATKNIEQDLQRLLNEEGATRAKADLDAKLAMAALASLVAYLDLLADEGNHGQFALERFDLSRCMRLDAAAVTALNLMPSVSDGGNKSMSLFGLLNKCRTAQGTRLLLQWLKQPLLDLLEIKRRQDLVEVFVEDTELRQTLQEGHLKRVPDLNRLAKRFQKRIANLQDVVRLYQVVVRLPELVAVLSHYQDAHAKLVADTFTGPLQQAAGDLEKFREMTETTIDLDAVNNHQFLIKADFDDGLQAAKAEMQAIEGEITAILMKVGRDLSLEPGKKLKLETSSQYGHYLKIARSDSAKIRNSPNYTELSTTKGGIYFTTSKLRQLSDKYTGHQAEYDRLQSHLVKEVITIVSTYCPVIEDVNELVAQLDVLLSLAQVAVQAPTPYARPTLLEKGRGEIVLKAARHPCMEVQDDVNFIPNDVSIVRGASTFQIITGPNMGGKSTYIRQIGVIVLLAQIGSFVPCAEATVSVCDAVLARVGAGDSQLKGVSTFMAEMLETASILKTATPSSLIIIDELGRGTSTYDGFGLAWAISEHISTKIGCPCLFATHFHELTALAEKVPGVTNLHVTAHTSANAITLLYKVLPGVCDQSFGIHVAELARFPEQVVKLAKRKAAELEDFSGAAPAVRTKCSRQEVEAGERAIADFLVKVAKLPLDTMDDQEVLAQLQVLRGEVDTMGNAYVQEVLADFL